MSEIRKWLKIMESIPAIFPNQDAKHALIKQDATVMVNPSVGGGTARYMSSTPNGAMVDIKGIAKELSQDEFSLPERDYEDGYQKGNDWFHMSVNPDTPGTMNDKPEFRAGNIVKIADVYGSVIGPGIGIFVAYSTSGKECIISFDDKEIVVPTANVGSVLEQNAKDNFGEMDNDGNLLPMSLGSKNVKIEEPEMDQRDEFSKWMSAVEEALTSEGRPELAESLPATNNCDCNEWDCPVCFPEMDPIAAAHDHEYDHVGCPKCDGKGCAACSGPELGSKVDEEDNDFLEKPKSGKGVKLGDIVHKTEFRKTGGQNSPMTYGDDNLDEELPDGANPADYGKAGRYIDKHSFGDTLEVDEGNWYDPDQDDFSDLGKYEPTQRDMADYNSSDVGYGDHQEDEEKESMISKITNIQNMGFSKDNRHYDEMTLRSYTPEELKACYDRVMGDVSEAKPTMTKQTYHHLDDIDDILNPRQAHLPAAIDTDDGEVVGDEQPMHLPAASRADTQRRVGAITPTDTMRDFMDRIDPMAGAGEADVLPDTQQNAVALRTAADVPVVISNAMQASGMQTPEWHTVNNLPGYSQRNTRGMGRQMFSMFTSTPLENIQTLANVNGQGPNTDAEMRAVAGWLRDNAEDLGEVNVSHGEAIPGYTPDVKEYKANGVRFQLVRDPMGQYIYAYPDADARLGGPQQGQAQVAGPQGGMPRLRESMLKPTLLEQMKWDEEIDEAFIEESTLSKLIGKQQGGQKLVQWLHRKHQLSNDANLEPAPFSERMLWKEFKAHPDNFVVVSAANGVAGVKPYKKFIDDRRAAFAKKGKTYNPAGDSTLPYQIIAFTDDGQQVDPNLFRQPAEPGEEPEERYSDPTVMKARMGKHSGKDMQNPNNTFNLLADEIGALKTVWMSTGSVERGKMAHRDAGSPASTSKYKDPEYDPNKSYDDQFPSDRPSVNAPSKGERDKMKYSGPAAKKSAAASSADSVKKIFARVRPVLKTLANQAILQINKRAQRYIEGGNFEGAQKVAASGQKLKQLLVSLDTSNDVGINTDYGSKTAELSTAITKAIAQASGSPVGSTDYNEYASEAAAGNAAQLRPILDALRDNLVGL